MAILAHSLATDPFFHSTDPLAQRDEWGLLHQMPAPNATDFAPRYHWRPLYYLKSGRELIGQPAYVGALQRDLRRLGYYCGPIDGVFSGDVSDAIARLAEKLFHARDRHAHGSGATSVVFALTNLHELTGRPVSYRSFAGERCLFA